MELNDTDHGRGVKAGRREKRPYSGAEWSGLGERTSLRNNKQRSLVSYIDESCVLRSSVSLLQESVHYSPPLLKMDLF